MSISPPPLGPLAQVAANKPTITELADQYRLITSVFGDAAVAGSEDAVIVGAGEAVGAMTAAFAGILAAIVIGIIILILVLVIVIHNTIRKQVSNIPLVGGALATVLDALYQMIEGIINWADNEFLSVWHGLLLEIHKLVSLMLSLFGLASLSNLQGQVNKYGAQLARLPYDVDALENRVMTALSTSLASLWTNIAELWHWIHVLLHDVNMIWNALHQIWSWIHHLLYVTAVLTQLIHWAQNEIHKLWHNISGLWNVVTSLQHRVTTLENEIVSLQHRVLTLESNVVPALETVAALALLLPLLDEGKTGVDTLVKLEKDPCMCLVTPGTKGFMLTSLVMYLWYRDGP